MRDQWPFLAGRWYRSNVQIKFVCERKTVWHQLWSNTITGVKDEYSDVHKSQGSSQLIVWMENIWTQFHSVESASSNDFYLADRLKIMGTIFYRNGYPKALVKNKMKKFLEKTKKNKNWHVSVPTILMLQNWDVRKATCPKNERCSPQFPNKHRI